MAVTFSKKYKDGADPNQGTGALKGVTATGGVKYTNSAQKNPTQETGKQKTPTNGGNTQHTPFTPQDTTVKTGTGTQTPTTGYTGLPGVSDNTAKQVGNYQQGYTPSDAVLQANQNLQNILDQKPEGYNSKYTAQLDEIMQKIQNPEKFQYTFNGDELFKSYADEYVQRGKQASLDTMGQAAALTGGYGNSYGTNAANQAYQQYLLGLYDKGLDLYDRAYQRYKDQQAGLYDQYNLMANADNTDYNRYRDQYNDWTNDRTYYTDRADTAGNTDYQRWQTERDYWTGLAQIENADYRSDQDRQEAIRQYDQNYLENKRQYDENLEYNKNKDIKSNNMELVLQILKNGQMPSKALLKAAGLSSEIAKNILANNKNKGSKSGGNGSGSGETYYKGKDGKYYKKDKTGRMVEVNYSDIKPNDLINEMAADEWQKTLRRWTDNSLLHT